MDEIHLDYPYYGVRRIMAELQHRGYGVGEKRVQRLMKLMGIEAITRSPRQPSRHLSTRSTRIYCAGSTSSVRTRCGRWTSPTFLIYIERFWRSIKYDDIYLNAYEDGVELWHGIDNYIRIYNTKRLHQSLDYQTPDEVYKNVS